jgi:DNA processing protein
MEERDYYLGFSLISGIGPKTFLSLLKFFKTAQKAWRASAPELERAGLSERLTKKLLVTRNEFNFAKYHELLKLKKASFVAKCDKEYPELLLQIPNPPIVLFMKGDKNVLWGGTGGRVQDGSPQSSRATPFIAIVGTRKITNYGREVTKLFSTDLAINGFTIVSGLAMGVDALAAKACIDVGGKTIAVLGNGVDLCFPSSNESLYDRILKGNGVIVSEFPLGQVPTIGSFPSRNRIIAGLSLGVLVTEGAQDSGSLITADYAFKFNRKVFAVPGPITSSLSVAPLKLIEKGAKLVTCAQDVCKELKIENLKPKTDSKALVFQNLTKEELKIARLLENEGLSFDEIVRGSKLGSSQVGSLLSMMEIKGFIKNTGNGSYALLNESEGRKY